MGISKSKIIALTAGIAAVSPLSHAEIELGQGFSVTGFVDMSFVYVDEDEAASTSKTFAVDQVETNFMYQGSNGVSAQVDIEYGESGTGNGEDETFVEQAFITKQINDSFKVKAGRFLSYSGWETEEPTGLFQYSGTGYAPFFYGFYQQGVSAYYDSEVVDVAFSIVNDVFADPIESDTTNLGSEFMVAVTPVEGLTAKLFYMTQSTDTDDDKEAINFWTAYSTGGLTLAFEYNTAEETAFSGSEADGYLLMANYASGDYGITLRYHDFEIEDAFGTTTVDASAITIAPSMAVGDNLLIVAEYRMDTDDVSDIDTDSFALEALFTF